MPLTIYGVEHIPEFLDPVFKDIISSCPRRSILGMEGTADSLCDAKGGYFHDLADRLSREGYAIVPLWMDPKVSDRLAMGERLRGLVEKRETPEQIRKVMVRNAAHMRFVERTGDKATYNDLSRSNDRLQRILEMHGSRSAEFLLQYADHAFEESTRAMQQLIVGGNLEYCVMGHDHAVLLQNWDSAIQIRDFVKASSK